MSSNKFSRRQRIRKNLAVCQKTKPADSTPIPPPPPPIQCIAQTLIFPWFPGHITGRDPITLNYIINTYAEAHLPLIQECHGIISHLDPDQNDVILIGEIAYLHRTGTMRCHRGATYIPSPGQPAWLSGNGGPGFDPIPPPFPDYQEPLGTVLSLDFSDVWFLDLNITEPLPP